MNLKNKLKYWCRISSKRITIVFLLVFTQFQMVYANTVAGGWSFTNPVSQGASTAWDATKNMGDKVAKGVASIKPTPSQVAKGILKGGLVGAALTATEQLLEDGVDFVLDPANNTIRFTKKPKDIDDPRIQYYYYATVSCCGFIVPEKNQFLSQHELCNYFNGKRAGSTGIATLVSVSLSLNSCKYDTDNNAAGQTVGINKFSNPAYKPDYKPDQKTLPIEIVASKIIDNADANDKEAEKYVNAVAQDSLENDEATKQMAISQADNSAKIQPPKGVPSTSENSANATPPPDDEDDVKRPNNKLEKGDKVDLSAFSKKGKYEGKNVLIDPRTSYMIIRDRAGANSHGGSFWKLLDKTGKRIFTLAEDGRVLRK